VETESEMRTALQEFPADVILSDFSLPRFDGMSALTIAREMCPHIPFIFVSGTIGEERAINAPALRRRRLRAEEQPGTARARRSTAHWDDVEARTQREQQQAQIGAPRSRAAHAEAASTRSSCAFAIATELLRETCRLAVSVGGYSTAIVSAKQPGASDCSPSRGAA